MRLPVDDAPGRDPLAILAEAHGIDVASRREHHDPTVLIDVLAGLGVDAGTPAAVESALDELRAYWADRLVPPFIAIRAGHGADVAGLSRDHRAPAGTVYQVALDTGDKIDLPGPGEHPATWEQLPIGRHTLHVQRSGRSDTATLLVVPAALRPVPGRVGGIVTQLYATMSRSSWGMGDLGDLGTLASWSATALGAGFVQLNPLHVHARRPDGGPATSPYQPSSRRFRDPMNIRIEAIGEYAHLPEADRHRVAELASRGAALTSSVLDGAAFIDRDAVWRLKREALELIFRVPRDDGRQREFQAFRGSRGAAVEEYALWSALADIHGGDWRTWPEGLRHPQGPAVARARDELSERITFHVWLMWIVESQLAGAQAAAREAGMSIGLIHDLAIGLHPSGADAWANQDYLASGLSIGAPPDYFSEQGQDWGMPPWRPRALEAAGYQPLADVLEGCLRHAGGLRMDHVMGLTRLWCIPEGRSAREGVYVRFDHRAMLSILMLEAHRADAVIIGEDLGDVEAWLREDLADRRILGTSVLMYEQMDGPDGGPVPRAPEHWRQQCLATVTTHDTPSAAGWLSREYVGLRASLGMLGRPEHEEAADATAAVDCWLGEFTRVGLLPDGATNESLTTGEGLRRAIVACYRFLLRTPATLIGFWLPDGLGDPRQPNVPSTSDQYPNWCLPVADATGQPVDLERLMTSDRLSRAARIFAELAGDAEIAGDAALAGDAENAEPAEDGDYQQAA